jgi:hypothetical protein
VNGSIFVIFWFAPDVNYGNLLYRIVTHDAWKHNSQTPILCTMPNPMQLAIPYVKLQMYLSDIDNDDQCERFPRTNDIATW